MNSPWSDLGSKASTLLLMLCSFAVLMGLIPRFADIGFPAAAVLACVAIVIWLVRVRALLRPRYLTFSLRTLLIFIVSLQIPVALLINPWNVEVLPIFGGIALALWFLILIVYSFDLAAGRYAREKTLQALSFEETKGPPKK